MTFRPKGAGVAGLFLIVSNYVLQYSCHNNIPYTNNFNLTTIHVDLPTINFDVGHAVLINNENKKSVSLKN